MKIKTLILVAFISLFNISLKADEGMWLLSLIGKNYEEMKAKGLKLTPEDIYNINHASLKDAIVGLGSEDAPFGFFCTGEIISSKGLVLTNHHCGYGKIQAHSTTEHNYLLDGFWAADFSNELPNEGMTMTRVVSMKDVSDKILPQLSEDMTETERHQQIQKISQELIKEAEKANEKYGYDVKSMFEGNQFFLYTYEVFKDIRLVGTPPASVGKYGGDTDNWMWPRHTGDFSMFRIYTNKDNAPAKYSLDNIPYKALHHLPVSIKGVEPGDYAMVLGFPGSTERYLTSYGIRQALDITNPTTVKIRDLKLKIMKSYMDKSDKIFLQYASKHAGTANYWKYFQGQSKGLKRLHVFEKKQDLENKLTEWINKDETRKKKYGEALPLLKTYFESNKAYALAKTYLFESIFQGPEVIMLPFQFRQLASVLANKPKDKDKLENWNKLVDGMCKELKDGMKNHWKDYNFDTDKSLFEGLVGMYVENVPDSLQLSVLRDANKKYKGNMKKYANDIYKKSIFASETQLDKFFNKPSAKTLTNDPIFKYIDPIIEQYMKYMGSSDGHDKGMRLFEAALMEMQKDKNFYPDANSTQRLTYGVVGDYDPRDGVHYKYFTTIDGIIEKAVPGAKKSDEFYLNPKLKELWEKKDYGQYADKEGRLHVCFLTNNDITGGNSGSPVINANGELIGTAFDGNWEAMSGDIAFEHKLQKCINLDARFTLFIIDKLGGAHRLIEEMDIVK